MRGWSTSMTGSSSLRRAGTKEGILPKSRQNLEKGGLFKPKAYLLKRTLWRRGFLPLPHIVFREISKNMYVKKAGNINHNIVSSTWKEHNLN